MFNTNSNTSLVDGIGVINRPGYYDVNAVLTLTNVAEGNISATFYSDNTDINGVTVTATSTGTTDFIPIALPDVIKVSPLITPTRASLSVRLDAPATVVANSQFTIELRK